MLEMKRLELNTGPHRVRGGPRIFGRVGGGSILVSSTSKKRGVPGGGPTLCPILKSLQRGLAKGGGGGPPAPPPGSAQVVTRVMGSLRLSLA